MLLRFIFVGGGAVGRQLDESHGGKDGDPDAAVAILLQQPGETVSGRH
ncbi:MAG TPA: hypothetical protein VFM15_09050 [Gammaproteobacteria bacterium]|nr:hypothetical protein [Gammaproteobacteria bacterium]